MYIPFPLRITLMPTFMKKFGILKGLLVASVIALLLVVGYAMAMVPCPWGETPPEMFGEGTNYQVGVTLAAVQGHISVDENSVIDLAGDTAGYLGSSSDIFGRGDYLYSGQSTLIYKNYVGTRELSGLGRFVGREEQYLKLAVLTREAPAENTTGPGNLTAAGCYTVKIGGQFDLSEGKLVSQATMGTGSVLGSYTVAGTGSASLTTYKMSRAGGYESIDNVTRPVPVYSGEMANRYQVSGAPFALEGTYSIFLG